MRGTMGTSGRNFKNKWKPVRTRENYGETSVEQPVGTMENYAETSVEQPVETREN